MDEINTIILGTTNVTFRLPAETPVDSRETIYKCMVFDYPQDGDYHMIANEPVLDNLNIMHHILLIGCDGTGKYKSIETFYMKL
jgi:dopamine beta-monooxygenase